MSANTFVKCLTSESFANSVSSGIVLVDFTAEWCGPCRMLAPVLEKVAEEVKDKALVAKVDSDESQDLAAKFNVTSVPTMILFKDGTEVERLVGLKDEDTLIKLINANHTPAS